MRHADWKAFHGAAETGDLELVDYYLRVGVDVNYEHPEYMTTAPVSAILAGQEEVVLFLMEHGVDPDKVSTMEQLSPLQAAQQVGMTSVVEKFAAQN
ncbi:MAG: ankyrin repeat domain-containing protein [Candidatus Nanopelagicales bacterium]